MTTEKDIDAFLLEDCQGKFKDKSWFFGLFGSTIYVPTGEKVSGGFRYFACPVAAVLQCFSTLDLAAMLRLPFALDDDGDPDTSSVLISLHYTESGSVLAMQVQEYQNYHPVPLSPVVLLEGAQAQPHMALVKELDQSN